MTRPYPPPKTGWLPDGEMARRVRAFDWAATPLGDMADWPPSLKTVVGLALASGHAMQIVWGPERTVIYNDAYAPMLGDRHPAALGLPFVQAWPAMWSEVAPLVARVFAGETVTLTRMPLVMTRHGRVEDTWWDFSYAPLRDETGAVTGLLNVTADASAQVRADRAEQALRQREADLARVQRIGHVGGINIDIADQMRGQRSPEYLRLHGLADAVRMETHQDWRARVHPDDRQRAEATLFAALESGAASYENEYRIIRPSDGAVRWIQARADIEHGPDGKPARLVGAHLDITEQKKTQEALQEKEERLSLAIDIGRLASWDWDMGSGKVNWNDRHFLMLGYGVGEVTPSYESWLARLHPEDRAETVAKIETARDTRTVYAHEFRVGHAGGSIRWCSARGQFLYDRLDRPYRMIGVMEDITERKLAETQLRDSEERLALAFKTLPIGLGMIDADGQPILFNDEMRRFLPTGVMPSRDPERMTRWIGLDAQGRKVAPENFPGARALRGETVLPGLQMLYRDDAGREIWTEVLSAPLHDRDGKVIGALVVVVDQDRLKRSEEALRASEGRQRVLVAELQHRTRNLIAVVQSVASQTVYSAGNLADFEMEFRRRLNTLSRVQGLLSRGSDKPITIGELVAMELDAVAPDPEPARMRIGGPSVPVRQAIVQTMALALHELATNAVKHGALATHAGELDVTWRVQGGNGSRRLVLEWVESGLALPPEQLANARHGYGRELIEKALPYSLGATTRFELKPEGAACTIDLPLGIPGNRHDA